MRVISRFTVMAAAMVIGGFGITSASAQSVVLSPASVNGSTTGGATSPGTIAVNFTNGGTPPPTGFQLDVVIPNEITVTRTTSNPSPGNQLVTCTIIPDASTAGLDVVRVVALQTEGDPLANGNYCNINTSVVAGTAVGNYPLIIEGAVNLASTTGSAVSVSALGDSVLSFTPAPGGTVTFPVVQAGSNASQSIAINAGGTSGAGSVSGCTAPAGFTVPAAPINVTAPGTGSIPLGCTAPASGGALTGTLSCTVTDSANPAGIARTWNLSCPQGTPVPGPGFGASPAPNPAPAAPILCNGRTGETVQRQITITNSGFAGANSELTFSCTGGAGIASVVSGGSTAAPGLAVGASQVVTVACAVPADGVTETGTVSCTTNAPGGPFVFNYSSTGSTLPPPVARPAVVPASSAWSQIALIALLAGLGLAFVGFRRGQ